MLRLLQRRPILARLCLLAVLGGFGVTGCDNDQDSTIPETTVPVSPAPESIPEGVTSISGVVLDQETGAPIVGAIVQSSPGSETLRTDEQGRFVLSVGLAGDRVYRVTVEAEGYTLASRVLVTRQGRQVTSDFQMVPSLGTSPVRFEPEASFFPINKHIALHRLTNTSDSETIEWSLDLPEWISAEQTAGSLPPNATSIVALRVNGEGFAASSLDELDGQTILRDNTGRFRILNMKALRADPSTVSIQRVDQESGQVTAENEVVLNLGDESVLVLEFRVQSLSLVGAEIEVDTGGAVRDTLVTDGGGRVTFPVSAIRPGETTVRFSVPAYPDVPAKEILLRVLADDVDEDGIIDELDNCPEIANPEQEDLDGDNQGDLCDIDRDGDGVDNEEDNCPDISNTDQENIDEDENGDLCDTDIDGDGIDNEEDNCPNVLNADQANLDEDESGDLCDTDIDGDGVDNEEDNCRLVPNEDQANLDEDEVGDLCDTDIDGDGVENDVDNCHLIPNEDQANLDEDENGDLCDEDIDGDSIPNEEDNCALVANAEQRDIDEDASGDACDIDIDGDGIDNEEDNCALVANPGQENTDEDPEGDACDGDADGDGVPNEEDNCQFVANADQSNLDEDEVGDLCDTDIDGDGLENVDDNCPEFANEDQANLDEDAFGDACDTDLDGDGIDNEEDNCPDVDNPTQANLDEDEEGDLCDEDIDGDGIPEASGEDNCPDAPNAGQEDRDEDGVGDACDACPDDFDNDTDEDGVCGDVDNCPDEPNAEQEDSDEDGVGNLCDACPNDPADDIDEDGLCADVDNCPEDFNPEQGDRDENGIGDACDSCVEGEEWTDPVTELCELCPVSELSARSFNFNPESETRFDPETLVFTFELLPGQAEVLSGTLFIETLNFDGYGEGELPNSEMSVPIEVNGGIITADLTPLVETEQFNPFIDGISSVRLELTERCDELGTRVVDDFVIRVEPDEVLNVMYFRPAECVEEELGSVLGSAVSTGSTFARGRDHRPIDVCGSSVSDDVGFSWVAPFDGVYTFDTFGSEYDTVLYALPPQCDGELLVCNDDAGEDLQSAVSLELGAGEEIVLVVAGYSGDEGDYRLNVTPESASCPEGEWVDLANAACQACPAGVLDSGILNFDLGSGSGLDLRSGEITFALNPGIAQVATATLFIEGFDFSGYGAVNAELPLNVGLQDLRGNLSEVFDFANEGVARASLRLTQVCDIETEVDITDLIIQVEPGEVPTVHNFRRQLCEEVDLESDLGRVAEGTLLWEGRDHEAPGECVDTQTDDVGFLWTAPAAGLYTFNTYGSDFDTALYVLPPACDPVAVACNDNDPIFEQQEARVTFPAEEGESFVVVVAGSGEDTGDYALNVHRSCEEGEWFNNVSEACQACPAGIIDSSLIDFSRGSATGFNPDTREITFALRPGTVQVTRAAAFIQGLFPFQGEQLGLPIGDSAFIEMEVRGDVLVGRLDDALEDGFDVNFQGIGAVELILEEPCAFGEPQTIRDLVVQIEPSDGGFTVHNFRAPMCSQEDLGSGVGPEVATGTTLFRGRDHEVPFGCEDVFSYSDDVGFTWTAPQGGAYRIDTFGSNFDTVLYVLPPACFPNEALACNNDAFFGEVSQSEVFLEAAEGQQFVIVVGGFADQTGQYQLNIFEDLPVAR